MIAHADPTNPALTPIGQLEMSCERLRGALDATNKICDLIDRDIEAIKAKHRKRLQELAESITTAEQIVWEQVQSNRHLFPDGNKTRTFSGIEVGFQKERDSVETPDDEILIQRIEQMLPDKKDVLITTKKSVIKAAFKKLAWAIKQKLGCREVKGGDSLVIRLVQGDARNRVSAYLTEAQFSPERAA